MFFASYQHWLNKVYPPTCLLCQAPGDSGWDLCSACHSTLPINDTACPCCGLHQNSGVTHIPCGNCQTNPPAFDHCCAPYRYAYPLDGLLQQFKFGERLAAGRVLAKLMQNAFADVPQRPDALLPVPLHKSALRERGFNQATELARALACALQLPLLLDTCERRMPTARQSRLRAAARQRNIKDAFQLLQPLHYQHIAIVDDVVTTGATANELARTLKATGVKRVDVWCLARAGF